MSSETPIPIIRHQPASAFQNAPRYLLDYLFRAVLLVVLVAGLILAIWHISWLHNQAGTRYEMQITSGVNHPSAVVILYRQERVIYASDQPLGFGKEPIVWHTSPLPK
jgi:hypothetical protein